MEQRVIENRKNMTNVMSQREDFLIIALTGRMGSGCSTVGDIFCTGFEDLNFLWPVPVVQGMRNDEEREIRILARYANSHWLRFERIRVRNVITSFLLEDIDLFIEEIKKVLRADYTATEDIKEVIKNEFLTELQNLRKTDVYCDEIIDNYKKRLVGITDEQVEELKKLFISEEKQWDVTLFNNKDIFEVLYQQFYDQERLNDRRLYMEAVDNLLNLITEQAASAWENKYKDNIWERLKKIDESLFLGQSATDVIQFEKFIYVKILIELLGNTIHKFLKKNCREDAFSALYQKYGNQIRKNGYIFKKSPNNSKDDIFQLPRKINRFIKVFRHPFKEQKSRPVRIVIDSLKNVFEAAYLRYRYTAFYLIAVSADDTVRERRLSKKDLNRRQICFLNWNEYPSYGVKLFHKLKAKNGEENIDEIEKAFVENIENTSKDGLYDGIREDAYTKKLHQFYLQDVEACIQNADIFISNSKDSVDKTELTISVVRDICLIMCPGLIQPTPIERCMQIAYAAKANSGCLSRQVGAVVTDKDYNILSVGWNDPPCGEVSCARRNLVDITRYRDKDAYSEYEWNDPNFRQRTKEYSFSSSKLKEYLHGLPFRYCFKDFHIDEKNPMRSRAMHAEEKAFSVISLGAAEGGALFTTSSPCEMCTKNAKNHKVKNIYYIELYPGISENQYSYSGKEENRANHILYTGAVGRAYTQMYTPIMPYKDMLALMGVEEFKVSKR